MVGHLHVLPDAGLVLAPRDGDLRHRGDAAGGTEPAHQRLVPDAHRHHVEAAQRGILPPVERLVRVDEPRLVGLDLDGEGLADVALGQQRLHRRVDLERVRRRHQLGNQMRRPARGVEHPPSLGGVHGHARLAQHVLAIFENGPRDLAVRVGPGADADRVDVGGVHELAPVPVHPLDAELGRDAVPRFLRPVGHRRQLDPGLRSKLRDVMLTTVGAGAHEPHADRLVGHGAAW